MFFSKKIRDNYKPRTTARTYTSGVMKWLTEPAKPYSQKRRKK